MLINITNNTKTRVEDFEEFDLRDAINVGAYGLMSIGEYFIKKSVLFP